MTGWQLWTVRASHAAAIVVMLCKWALSGNGDYGIAAAAVAGSLAITLLPDRPGGFVDLLLRRNYWRRCQHRSHRWPHWRTCLRFMAYDYQCCEHNRACFGSDRDGRCGR